MIDALNLLKGHLRLTSRYEEDGRNTIYARYCECGAKFTTDISVFLHHYELIKGERQKDNKTVVLLTEGES